MGKVGFEADNLIDNVRPANSDDIPGIVAASAKHRDTLSQISDRFWNIHPDADERFGNWMKVSLGLTDRDMFVAGGAGQVQGYIIAQPVSRLLVPTAHEIKELGVIDDFYHVDFAHISEVENDGMGAANLLLAAESSFAKRNVEAALVVCPAGWARADRDDGRDAEDPARPGAHTEAREDARPHIDAGADRPGCQPGKPEFDRLVGVRFLTESHRDVTRQADQECDAAVRPRLARSEAGEALTLACRAGVMQRGNRCN
jgi:hypothetical protein